MPAMASSCNASEAVLKRNKAIGNGESGFVIGGISFGELTRNRAIGNRFFGIHQFAGFPTGGDGAYKTNICRRNGLGASSLRGPLQAEVGNPLAV
jgi:hypothetical protein